MKKLTSLIFLLLATITTTSCKAFGSTYSDELVSKTVEGNDDPFNDKSVGYDTFDEDKKSFQETDPEPETQPEPDPEPAPQPQPQPQPDPEPAPQPQPQPQPDPEVEEKDVYYTIKFVDGSGTTLQESQVLQGVMPIYDGPQPTKTSSQHYKYYTFERWQPAIGPAVKNQTYTAYFTEGQYEYRIRFFEADGYTPISDTYYKYGQTVTKPKNPTKAQTVSTSYTFQGWSTTMTGSVIKNIPTVTADADYFPIFTERTVQYTVKFFDEDGKTVLDERKWDFDATPVFKDGKQTPTKNEDDGYTYTFKAWTPSISRVTGNASYVASYQSTVKKYTVKFYNENSEVHSCTVNYGSKPTYTAATPTKASNSQYSYTFIGWNADPNATTGVQVNQLPNVTKNTPYYAIFSKATREYKVEFRKPDSTSNIQEGYYKYGTRPSYTGATPTKATYKTLSEEVTYSFIGWNTNDKATAALSPLPEVTRNLVFYPIFSSTVKKLTEFELVRTTCNVHLKEVIDLIGPGYEFLKSSITWEIPSGSPQDVAWVNQGDFRLIINKEGSTILRAKTATCTRQVVVNVYKLTLKSKLSDHTIRTRHSLVDNNYGYQEGVGYILQKQRIYWDQLMYFENGEKLTNPVRISDSTITSNVNWIQYTIRSESYGLSSKADTSVDLHITQYDFHDGRRCFLINNDTKDKNGVEEKCWKHQSASKDKRVEIVVNFRSPYYPEYKSNNEVKTLDYRIYLTEINGSESSYSYYVKNPSSVFK